MVCRDQEPSACGKHDAINEQGAAPRLTRSNRMVMVAMRWAMVVKNRVGRVICDIFRNKSLFYTKLLLRMP